MSISHHPTASGRPLRVAPAWVGAAGTGPAQHHLLPVREAVWIWSVRRYARLALWALPAAALLLGWHEGRLPRDAEALLGDDGAQRGRFRAAAWPREGGAGVCYLAALRLHGPSAVHRRSWRLPYEDPELFGDPDGGTFAALVDDEPVIDPDGEQEGNGPQL